MAYFDESKLEMSIINQLESLEYTYVKGDEIPRNPDEVVLMDDLRAYFRKRYKSESITDSEIESAIKIIMQKQGGSIYEDNKYTIDLYMHGFSLKRQDPSLPNLYVYPLSFDREHLSDNIFKIVNQFEITDVKKRRPDAIIFINGLPVVLFEFKSAIKENTTIFNAYKQITDRYRRDIPSVFKYTALTVLSDGVNNKFGSLYTPYEFYSAWRKVEAKDKPSNAINTLDTMLRGLFSHERLLDVIHNFIFFPDTTTGREEKFICRYPQYFAARALYQNILNHSKLNPSGDGKGGTYFGATGCGKSMTMLFLCRLLMKSTKLNNPTIVFITDRTDLDDQLSRLLLKAKKYVGDNTIVQVESREMLGEYLRNRASGGVFLTTIQKFSKDIDLLSSRANIICISDEAHRSQISLDEKVSITDTEVKRSYGFARYLHDSLPNATYVGFTGTPIDATLDVFGDIIDEYTMVDAVIDEITKSIVYEGRASKVILDPVMLRQIEDYYNRCKEEGASEYQIEESKKAMSQMSVILSNPDLLKRLAADFIQHYEKRVLEGSTVRGKAMIVTPTREIAYAIYKEIIALRPEWAEVQECCSGEVLTDQEREKIRPVEKVKVICIRDKDDSQDMYDALSTDEERKKLDLQFKEEKSNFKIAIVVDMWITGFDVPCLDSLYCYKPLQMHTLIQTISRVNRNYPGKDKGLVVDYLGIKKNFNLALKQYANGKQESETPDETVEQAITFFRNELDILRRMFHGFDYSAFFLGTPTEQLQCLNRAAEHIQNTEELEQRFMKHTIAMKSAYNICCNSDEISKEDEDDMHFLCAVRSVIYKITRGEAPDATQMNMHVMKLVNQALISEEVVELNNMVLSNTQEINLLAQQYMERLSKIPYENTKIRLMEQLLKRVIDEVRAINRLKATNFTTRLNDIVRQYNDRSDDALIADEIITAVAKQLEDLMKDIQNDAILPEGIPDVEVKAFYDILKDVADKYGFLDKFTEEQYKQMAIEVKKVVDDNSQYTDWNKRADILASLKVAIILTLSHFGFPPKEPTNSVYKAIFEQAENYKKNSVSPLSVND